MSAFREKTDSGLSKLWAIRKREFEEKCPAISSKGGFFSVCLILVLIFANAGCVTTPVNTDRSNAEWERPLGYGEKPHPNTNTLATNTESEISSQTLAQRIRNGERNLARWVTPENADLPYDSKYNFRPIHFAASRGDMPLARALVAKGANLKTRHKSLNNETPVEMAIDRNNISVAKYIASHSGEDFDLLRRKHEERIAAINQDFNQRRMRAAQGFLEWQFGGTEESDNQRNEETNGIIQGQSEQLGTRSW